MEKKVSIIIPVYNVIEYLETAVNSVRNQTYENVEIILVDDGSVDGSGELCNRFAAEDSRIKVLHQENRGVVAARGHGIAQATGEYISFVDGDDYIEPDMVKSLIEQIGEADLISSGVFKYVSFSQIVKRTDDYEEGLYEGKKYDDFLQSMIFDKDTEKFQRFTPWMWNKLFRRELVQAVYEKMDCKMRHTEDAVFVYLYLLRCRSVVITKDFFYHYLYRQTSVCHSVNERMLMDINRGYLVLKNAFKQHTFGDVLFYQLQKWVIKSSCFAMNNHMGFEPECSIPEFIVDASDLHNKKIVLYGAGKMGKDYKKQLMQFGYNVVLWVDKDFDFYRENGLAVKEPTQILETDYDVILIAVSREKSAMEISDDLISMGIDSERIVWRNCMNVF